MLDFQFYSPTKFVFGKSAETQIGSLCREFGGKILIHYGMGSVIKSGLLGRVKDMLNKEGVSFAELGGVKPNPELGLVRKGIVLCKNEKVEAVLAIGGGSAIDSAKAIAAGACYDGDVWDFYCGKPVTAALPLGVVLTLPAAGSEGSPNSVLTKEEGRLKRGASGDCLRPKFAVMNPELTYTLPQYQTACGISDICAHVIERYFTKTENVDVTDRLCEALMKSVIKAAPAVINNPKDYAARSEIMWAGSLAHNNTVGVGREQDWASHRIAHEISALYDTAHGATLSVIIPAWMKYVYKSDIKRFALFAARVFDVPYDMDEEAMAKEGINRYEAFLKSIELPTCMNDISANSCDYPIMAAKCAGDDFVGGFLKLDKIAVEAIYNIATK